MVPVRPAGVPQHGVPGQRPQLHMQGDMQQHIRGVADVEFGVLRLQGASRPAGVPQHGVPGQRLQLHMQGNMQQHIRGVADVESGVLRLQRQ